MDGRSLLVPQGYNVILECDSPNPRTGGQRRGSDGILGDRHRHRGQYGSPESIYRQRTVRITR